MSCSSQSSQSHDGNVSGTEAKRNPITVHSVPIRMPDDLRPPTMSEGGLRRPSGYVSGPTTAEPPVRSTAGRLVRRGTHDSFVSYHSTPTNSVNAMSVKSDCIVRRNSIGFRHVDSDDNSSYNSSNSETSNGNFTLNSATFSSNHENGSLEGVVDVAKPRNSLVSLSTHDSQLLASALFKVANNGNDGSTIHGNAPVSLTSLADLPEHWQAGDASKEEAHFEDGDKSLDKSATSGFWSALARRHSSMSNGDDEEESVSLGSSRLSESSPLSRKARVQLRRKMYMWRCAKAMAGFAALATLSLSAIYFIAEDSNAMFDGVLGRLFGQKETDDNLNQRKLPEDYTDYFKPVDASGLKTKTKRRVQQIRTSTQEEQVTGVDINKSTRNHVREHVANNRWAMHP